MPNLYICAHKLSKAKDPFWRCLLDGHSIMKGGKEIAKHTTVKAFLLKKDAQEYIDLLGHADVWEVLTVPFKPKQLTEGKQ